MKQGLIHGCKHQSHKRSTQQRSVSFHYSSACAPSWARTSLQRTTRDLWSTCLSQMISLFSYVVWARGVGGVIAPRVCAHSVVSNSWDSGLGPLRPSGPVDFSAKGERGCQLPASRGIFQSRYSTAIFLHLWLQRFLPLYCSTCFNSCKPYNPTQAVHSFIFWTSVHIKLICCKWEPEICVFILPVSDVHETYLS